MLYKLSTQYKKSAYDVENWVKEDRNEDGTVLWMEREHGYRWGWVTFNSDEYPSIDLKNEHGFNLTEDLMYEIGDMELDDGCWSDYRYSDKISEEYAEELEQMDHDELIEDGWILEYVDTIFAGPLVLEDEHGNIVYGEPSES